jgi:hypothetical protein
MKASIPTPQDLRSEVQEIHDKVFVAGPASRRLGFIVGPLAFDNSDDDIRKLVGSSFDAALDTGVAVGFHIDDQMFWGRLKKKLNLPGNIEWLDWSGTPNTGRRLDWSSKPLKIMPQLCLNSTGVTAEVKTRAALIGEEIKKGLARLHASGKDDLFIGVIAGWETQIGRDYKTGNHLGYCALSNAGYSALKPPADIDAARMEIVHGFIDLWASSLKDVGVPEDKIFSHTAFMSETVYNLVKRLRPEQLSLSYMEVIDDTRPEVAFGPHHQPGFSTYPEAGHLDQLFEALKQYGEPAWASAEGTSVSPAEADKGKPGRGMEGYLGNLFNHGARFVNIFGWGVGDQKNAFRRTAEGEEALAAYHKFLRGEPLEENRIPVPEVPSEQLQPKMRRLQSELPAYIVHNGVRRVKPLMEKLDGEMKAMEFAQAEKTADEVLGLIEAK